VNPAARTTARAGSAANTDRSRQPPEGLQHAGPGQHALRVRGLQCLLGEHHFQERRQPASPAAARQREPVGGGVHGRRIEGVLGVGLCEAAQAVLHFRERK